MMHRDVIVITEIEFGRVAVQMLLAAMLIVALGMDGAASIILYVPV